MDQSGGPSRATVRIKSVLLIRAAAQKLSPGRLLLESQAELGGAMLKVLQLALAQLLVVRLRREWIVGLAMLEHVVDNPSQLVGRGRDGVLRSQARAHTSKIVPHRAVAVAGSLGRHPQG